MTKPRCFLVYALAPEGTSHNAFVGDRRLPLVVFHDHFIGRAGGVAIFFAETPPEREALAQSKWLDGWQVDIHPLIFSHSPAAFDEQIAFTLRTYRGLSWERVQREDRPDYSNRGNESSSEGYARNYLGISSWSGARDRIRENLRVER